MKFLILHLFHCRYGGYGYVNDYSQPANRVRENIVNRVNADRQLAVNAKARAFGASDGTAYYNGVPGKCVVIM